jgi:hypothetical protein
MEMEETLMDENGDEHHMSFWTWRMATTGFR